MRTIPIFVSCFMILCLGQHVKLHAQAIDLIEEEGKVKFLLQSLATIETEAQRDSCNHLLVEHMEKLLQSPEAFDYPFDSLRSISSTTAEDQLLRVFSWNVPRDNYTNYYYCFLLHRDKKNKKHRLIAITDTADNSNWQGAIYYQLVPMKSKGSKAYVAIGWDGRSRLVHRKVIDVLSFDKGNLQFGAPIFRNGKKTFSRVVFDYSAKVSMFVRYEPEKKRIVFDHLSPERQGLEGRPEFYGPDMSFDAYLLEKKEWVFHSDIDFRGNR